MKRLLIITLLGFGIWSLGFGEAFADRRSYVWTYEYMTMPKGMAEVEYYNTLEYADANTPKVSTWKHLFEYEYGITDRWDISMYQQFKQTNTAAANTLSYDGYKIRTRYRIGERNSLPIDTLLYLEYIGKNDLSALNQAEIKLILAKDIGRFNIAYNQILKQTLNSGGATEHEYAAGMHLEFSPALKIGIEGKGNYSAGSHYVGPTISVATDKFWANFGILKGLTSNANYIQSRFLMGIHI